MFKRLLVPLDGSPLAERAIPMAASIARASGASIVLLRVVNPPVEYGYWAYPTPAYNLAMGDWRETDFNYARDYLKEIAASSDLVGVGTSIEVHTGQVAAVIFNITQTQKIDLVVISSHGDTGLKLWALGSVAQKVARLSSVPVLVLRERETAAEKLRLPHSRPYTERPLRILVPLDGSALAKEVLAPAAQLITALADPGQGAIHLLRVIKPRHDRHEDSNRVDKEAMLLKAKKYLSSIAEHLKEGIASQHKLAVTWSVALDEDVASAIIRVAENGEDAEGSGVFGGCDLITISTHGRGGLQRWAMGSITERVLHGTNLPLLIVRPQKTQIETAMNENETMINV